MSEDGKPQEPETQDVSEEEIGEFDDAALDKYLGETPEEPESPEPTVQEPETAEEPTPPEPEATPPAAEEEPAPPQEDKLKSLEERLATLQKQVQDKEDYIQQRSREIGDLRKQLREKAAAMRGEVPDLVVEDPVAAVERVLEARETEAELARLEMEEATGRNRALVLKAIPDIDTKLDAIAEIAASDGVPPQMIEAFKRNPFATSAPILKMLADRADKATRLRDLQVKLDAMNKESENVAAKIAAAAKKPPVMTGKTGGAATRNDDRYGNVTEDDLAMMTEAELDRLLEQEG